MHQDRSLVTFLLGAVVAGLFVWVGLAMAHDPPAPADAAVGKGLLTMGAATFLATLGLAIVQAQEADEAKDAARRASAPKTDYRDEEGA